MPRYADREANRIWTAGGMAEDMLALRTTVTVQQQDGPDFAQPLTRKVPLYLRLGFRYHY